MAPAGGVAGGAVSASGCRRRLPGGDGGAERRVGRKARLGRPPLVRRQRAQHIFAREAVDVVAVLSHRGIPSARCRLRRSIVLTVATGRSKRRDSSSRLQP